MSDQPGKAESRLSSADLGLYALVVLAWGTSWIGMKWQMGAVAPEVSLLWRFSLAFPMMFAWAVAARQPLRFDLATHFRLAVMGASMFSTNLILFYTGSQYIATGLMSVVFSLSSIFNMVLGAIFIGQRIERRLLIAACIGVAGVVLMFIPEIGTQALDERALMGLGISLAATMSFCGGTIVSATVQRAGAPVLSSTAWGMLYGAAILLVLALLRGQPMIVEWNFRYLGSLVWLAVVASVLAFASFLTLLGRMGAARVGYMTILFPVVALAVSTVVEGYRWTPLALVGLVLVMGGNVLMMRRGTGGRR